MIQEFSEGDAVRIVNDPTPYFRDWYGEQWRYALEWQDAFVLWHKGEIFHISHVVEAYNNVMFFLAEDPDKFAFTATALFEPISERVAMQLDLHGII